MRKTLLAAALVVVVAAPPAWAQPDKKAAKAKTQAPAKAADTSVEDENGTSDDEAEAGPMEGSAQVVPGKAPTTDGAGTTHTVEKGDTLWDLSQRYMGSPWYWPKVWSYNPEIANPHWIYPGNLVRFFSTGEEVPTQVEVGEPVEEAAPIAEDTEKVVVTGPIGYVPKSGYHLRTVGFVTPKEIEEAGSIVGSFDESEMLSFPQSFYASFKKKGSAKLGDRYFIFRTEKEIIHPKTEEPVGYLTNIVGTGRVVASSNDVVTLAITASFDEIRRGDLLGPAGENLMKTVSPRSNEKELKGTIVSAVVSYQASVAQNSLVVIDLGSDQGVQQGNQFTIVRQQEGLNYENLNYPPHFDGRWPKESVGSCIAFDVKSGASTCLLTHSLREITAGDNVEMKVGASVSAPRASR